MRNPECNTCSEALSVAAWRTTKTVSRTATLPKGKILVDWRTATVSCGLIKSPNRDEGTKDRHPFLYPRCGTLSTDSRVLVTEGERLRRPRRMSCARHSRVRCTVHPSAPASVLGKGSSELQGDHELAKFPARGLSLLGLGIVRLV